MRFILSQSRTGSAVSGETRVSPLQRPSRPPHGLDPYREKKLLEVFDMLDTELRGNVDPQLLRNLGVKLAEDQNDTIGKEEFLQHYSWLAPMPLHRFEAGIAKMRRAVEKSEANHIYPLCNSVPLFSQVGSISDSAP